MLRENPKKQKSGEPTKQRLFWRIQKECWRRMVTPFLMYLFMSLIAFACQAIKSGEDGVSVIAIVLGSVCIVCGAAFNAHLCYLYGVKHYDAYITGCLHRRNAVFGIVSGGDHQVEKEYRPWKGFFIGFLIGVPVLVLGTIGYFSPGWGGLFMLMFVGWSILPVQWIRNSAGLPVNTLWSFVMILLPVIVSGVSYIVGAMVEKHKKETEPVVTEEKKGKKSKK